MTRIIEFDFILKIEGGICVIIEPHFQSVANLSIQIDIDFLTEIEGGISLHPNRNRRVLNSITLDSQTHFDITLWFDIHQIRTKNIIECLSADSKLRDELGFLVE